MRAMRQVVKVTRAVAMVVIVGAFQAGCGSMNLLAEETAGERFRKVLAEIDARCREDKIGPYLDPNDHEYRRKVAITSCDILKLEPRDWRAEKMVRADGQHFPVPERWLATPEDRFAHSIKLPAPHDKPRSLWRPGMTQSDYFAALCQEEAGEFVFRFAEAVETVFEARVRKQAREEEFSHLYAMEDPYGYVYGESIGQIGATWTSGNAYRAIERSSKSGSGFEHLFRRSIREITPQSEIVPERVARYGFVWRGIVRPQDRENGIAGGELVVYDVRTGEVLGFRRGFAATGVGRRGTAWEFPSVCPNPALRGGRSKDFDSGLWFVSRVLRPLRYVEYRRAIGADR